MPNLSSLGYIMSSARSYSSSDSDCDAETFESTVPEGFRDHDFGVALLIDKTGLAKRGAMAGYATPDAALKAIMAIMGCAGLRLAKPSPSDTSSASPSSVARSGSSGANTSTCSSRSTSITGVATAVSGSLSPCASASISSNLVLFAGTADAVHMAMTKLRLAVWLRHTPGMPDVGRFYSVYPRGALTARYVAQDSVFNEV